MQCVYVDTKCATVAMDDEYLRDLMHTENPTVHSKKRKTDSSKKTLDCECTSPHAASIAFDTQGCLKCPRMDCAFYIQNFVETFLHCHNVEVYHISAF